MYFKNERYYCYSVGETVLNEYERQYGKEARLKLTTEQYYNLIDTIESNSFCRKYISYVLLIRSMKDNYDLLLFTFLLQRRSRMIYFYCFSQKTMKNM